MMIISYIKALVLRNPFLARLLKDFFGSPKILNCSFYQKVVLFIARKQNIGFDKTPFPPGITIETTLTCNAKCTICYHSQKSLSGLMKQDLFEKIVDECHENHIKNIGLSLYGEPLADPMFWKRIEYLRSKEMLFGFFTNASLLNKEKSLKLLETKGLTKINFSVNGFFPETYEKVMVGLNREKSYKNVLDFLDLKRELNLKELVVSVSCVKGPELSEYEAVEFLKFWKKYAEVDQVIIADLWDRMGDKQTDSSFLGPLQRQENWHSPCKQLWGGLSIYYDGRVSPCCVDADLRHLIVGNLNKQTIKDVWANQSLKTLRKTHLKNRRSEHPVCGKCGYNSVWF